MHVCARKQQDIDRCLEEWNNKGLRITGSVCDVLSQDQRKDLMENVGFIFQGKLNILVYDPPVQINFLSKFKILT